MFRDVVVSTMLCAMSFSRFWNFLDFSRPVGQKTGTSMSTINTFKQGRAFLIKFLQELREAMEGEGGLLDQAIKGTSVMNQRKKKTKKELGKGGEKKN